MTAQPALPLPAAPSRPTGHRARPLAGAVAALALGLALLAPAGVARADTATPNPNPPRLDPVAPHPRAYECREYLAEVTDYNGDGQGVVRLVWKYECRPIY
jgi:hypothetical protein